jgi:hypothetical protein
MFGGLPRFTIGNPKYPEGPGGPGGPSGFDFPPLGSDGCLAKILFTFMGIYVCTLIRFIPFGICGLYFIAS